MENGEWRMENETGKPLHVWLFYWIPTSGVGKLITAH